MSDYTTDSSAESAAEILRLTVPLMSRHQVPATPENYATWYAYASGADIKLKAEIDRLIETHAVFTPELNTRLYREFVAEHDIRNIEKVQSGLQKMLAEVGASLGEAGNDAAVFSGTLDQAANAVGATEENQTLRDLIGTLIAETRQMQATARSMQSDFESKTQEIEELQEELKRERQRAITDPLTGLYNRLALIDRMNAVLGEFVEHDDPPSLVMLDIDHFKKINDTHGHLIGDRVIRFVAQTMEKNIKGQDCAARYGGEEFTLLLPQTPAAGAGTVAEKILKAVATAQLVRADNKEPLGRITLSAGVACYQRGEDIMDFIERADRALYRSKNDGRNRVTIAD